MRIEQIGDKTRCEKLLENREIFRAAYRLFRKTFRLTFQDFMDMNLSLLTLEPKLEIFKFDDWLHSKYGQYENEGLSMFGVLKKNYGEEIALKVKELI